MPKKRNTPKAELIWAVMIGATITHKEQPNQYVAVAIGTTF